MKKESIEELAKTCFDEMKQFNPKGGLKEFVRLSVIYGYNYSQEQLSELKEQRDEMLQMLEEICANDMYFEDDLDKIEQLIKKVKNG